MFQTDREYQIDSLRQELSKAEKNYVIQTNDYIGIQVYSNGGERLIDPDNELATQTQVVKAPEPIKYLVKVDGTVNLPMVGNIKLKGYSLQQADSLLSLEYVKYYKSPFVITKSLNKRVIVLGPIGSNSGITIAGKVIPLENENMNLVEVLALFGGITDRGKSYNIRVIRGDLKNPDVSIVDLSTIEGMKKANLAMQPNDIVYIESTRKPFIESAREVAPLVALFTNVLLTIVVLVNK